MRRLVSIAFFLEVGFALIVVPWSLFWDGNYFVLMVPALGDILTNNFVRGAVSGVGVLNLWIGFSELASLLMARSQPGAEP